MMDLTWVEISKKSLENNIKNLRAHIGDEPLLCPCIKANAYGHGLVETGKIFESAGADWLAVNAIYEARKLRAAGITIPILLIGYTQLNDLEEAINLDCHFFVYNEKTFTKLKEITKNTEKPAHVHIKLETGNNRQGIFPNELLKFAKKINAEKNIILEGISTHFANIEDTTDHRYAFSQLKKFKEAVEMLEENDIYIPYKHTANSAATLLYPETHFNLVRPGLVSYGMWPSTETYVSFLEKYHSSFTLYPAFTWKAKIAQIKEIPAGEYIGYGCTYKTTSPTKIAIIPVGYYDGYDRGMQNAYVLIHGKRAYVRGRICMNIIMVDVTDIPEASLENEVTILGRDGEEFLSAEKLAGFAGTINYEITTRVNERIERRFV